MTTCSCRLYFAAHYPFIGSSVFIPFPTFTTSLSSSCIVFKYFELNSMLCIPETLFTTPKAVKVDPLETPVSSPDDTSLLAEVS
ncbi:hypothetical protein ACFX2J_007340 [Malus domestica]